MFSITLVVNWYATSIMVHIMHVSFVLLAAMENGEISLTTTIIIKQIARRAECTREYLNDEHLGTRDSGNPYIAK